MPEHSRICTELGLKYSNIEGRQRGGDEESVFAERERERPEILKVSSEAASGLRAAGLLPSSAFVLRQTFYITFQFCYLCPPKHLRRARGSGGIKGGARGGRREIERSGKILASFWRRLVSDGILFGVDI